jgi:hypothetical protein
MKKLLLTLLIPFSLFSQTSPPPPPPTPPAEDSPTEDFGTTQNNIVGAQGRSFGGGSIIKPNPILTSADFAFIQNPTYESGWRYGTGVGYSRVNGGKGFGINAVLTFDLTQQTYSLYYRRNDWYFHLNTGKMGFTLNNGLSVTKTWEFEKVYGLTLGVQMGSSIVINGDKSSENPYFVAVPYVVLLGQKEITISEKFEWRPETFITLCSPYYDIGKNFFSTSNTFNAVVGNNVSYRLTKKFRLNVNWRMNMNTTPKWGLMNNVLIGTNLKF